MNTSSGYCNFSVTMISRRSRQRARANSNLPCRSPLIIVKVIQTTSWVTPLRPFLSQFRHMMPRVPARCRHLRKLWSESPFEIRVACGKIHSPSVSLSSSVWLRTPLCKSVWCSSFSHRSAYLQRQFPGSIKNCNSRFSSRYGTSSVVSLPVGRHYPGASRSLLYAAKEWYRVDGRRGKRTRTHAHRRCVCTRIHARYRGSNSPRCHEEGDRVNELPFCGPPDVFFLLIGMRAGIRRDQARCKRKIGGDDITADRRNDRNSSFGFGVEDDGRRRPYGKV